MRIACGLLILLFLFVFLLADDEPPIEQLLQKSDLVVVGKAGKNETIDAGNAPGLILKNTVTVEESLKGKAPAEISFSYVGYHPKLKINHLKEGQKYIFFLKKGGRRGKADYSLTDGDYGALAVTDALLAAVRKATLKGSDNEEKQPTLTAGARGRYAIVVAEDFEEQDTNGALSRWPQVLKLLQEKYQKTGCKVFRYKGMPNDAAALKKALAAYRPVYVCFLRRPKRCSGKFCVSVVKLMRGLDDDPYADAVWAIFTAYNDKDALKMVEAKPLLVRRHLSHVGSGWLKWFESGVSFNECNKGGKWIKEPGKEPEKAEGPNDTAEQWAKVLNGNDVDILSTSGHATERDWQMGYPRWGGKVKPAGGGKLAAFENLGRGKRHDIKTDNPKIYYSPGNCLIAHVPCERRFIRDCMVLSWMHNGVYQFFGHIYPQTRWCTAWGVGHQFFALQDTYTFAEAVYANRVASRYLTDNSKQGNEKRFWDRCLHITVLYGDPAWEARMKRVRKPLYEFKFNVKGAEGGRKKATLTLKFNYKCKIGGRNTPVFLLPFFISDWKVEKTDKGKAVIADNFVLFDLSGKEFNKGDKVKLVFSFKKIADLK